MKQEDLRVYSPIKLLYTAYTDERPIANTVMEEGFQSLDRELYALSDTDRQTVFRTFCDIYMENERLAFRAGLCSGFRLAEELKDVTFD